MQRARWSILLCTLGALGMLGGCLQAPGPPDSTGTVSPRPKAAFDVRWLEADTVELNAFRSLPSRGRRIVRYRWDFGDGSTADTNLYVVQHRYRQPGEYTVSLTISDEAAVTATSQRVIVVVPEGEVGFEVLDLPCRSRISRQTGLVIRSLAELQRLWIEAFGGLQRCGGPPTIDFAREMIVALFLGERAWPCCYIRLDQLRARKGRLEIGYTEIRRILGPGCVVLPVTTAPYLLVQAPRVDLPAIYFSRQRTEYVTCP